MKRLLSLILLAALASPAFAVLEMYSPPSTITRVPVDYRDSTDGSLISAATASDCEISEYNDGTNPSTFADATNEATEIATSSGTYYLNLTVLETDSDYTLVKCITTSANAMPFFARITHIARAVDFDNIDGGLGAAEIEANAIGASEIATDAIGALEIAAAAIGASELATDAIGAAELAANAIGSSEIATAAIDADAIATDAVGAAEAGFLTDSTGFAGANIAAILTDTQTTLDTKLNDIQGGTFSSATDSLEAIRDRGDAAWTTGSGTGLSPIATGTAQAATATSLTLASGETFADSELVGALALITGGTTGVGQTQCITANVGSTDVVTVDTWVTTPTGTITYEIVANVGAGCPVQLSGGSASLDTDANGRVRIVDGIGAGEIDTLSGAIVNVDLVDTTTTNTDMVGTDNAALATALATAQTDLDTLTGADGATLASVQGNYAPALASVATEARLAELDAANLPTTTDSILTDTAVIGAAGAGLTAINLPDQTMNVTGNLSGSVGSVTGAVGSVTGNVGGSVASVTGAVGSVTGAVGSVTADVTIAAATETDITNRVLERSGALICTVDSTNGAPTINSAICDLTLPRAGSVVTAETNAYIGYRAILTTSGAPPPVVDEAAWVSASTWSGVNSELTITLDPALPAAPANGDVFLLRP